MSIRLTSIEREAVSYLATHGTARILTGYSRTYYENGLTGPTIVTSVTLRESLKSKALIVAATGNADNDFLYRLTDDGNAVAKTFSS